MPTMRPLRRYGDRSVQRLSTCLEEEEGSTREGDHHHPSSRGVENQQTTASASSSSSKQAGEFSTASSSLNQANAQAGGEQQAVASGTIDVNYHPTISRTSSITSLESAAPATFLYRPHRQRSFSQRQIHASGDSDHFLNPLLPRENQQNSGGEQQAVVSNTLDIDHHSTLSRTPSIASFLNPLLPGKDQQNSGGEQQAVALSTLDIDHHSSLSRSSSIVSLGSLATVIYSPHHQTSSFSQRQIHALGDNYLFSLENQHNPGGEQQAVVSNTLGIDHHSILSRATSIASLGSLATVIYRPRHPPSFSTESETSEPERADYSYPGITTSPDRLSEYSLDFSDSEFEYDSDAEGIEGPSGLAQHTENTLDTEDGELESRYFEDGTFESQYFEDGGESEYSQGGGDLDNPDVVTPLGLHCLQNLSRNFPHLSRTGELANNPNYHPDTSFGHLFSFYDDIGLARSGNRLETDEQIERLQKLDLSDLCRLPYHRLLPRQLAASLLEQLDKEENQGDGKKEDKMADQRASHEGTGGDDFHIDDPSGAYSLPPSMWERQSSTGGRPVPKGPRKSRFIEHTYENAGRNQAVKRDLGNRPKNPQFNEVAELQAQNGANINEVAQDGQNIAARRAMVAERIATIKERLERARVCLADAEANLANMAGIEARMPGEFGIVCVVSTRNWLTMDG